MLLSIYFYTTHQTLKKVKNDQLQLLYSEIKSEKHNKLQLNNVQKEVEEFQKKTQTKIKTIKINILNISFTLDEIFS